MRIVNDDLLEEMTQRLVDQFQPEQVILFGSYAWGMLDQYSDVDVMVILPHSDLSDYERAVQAHRCLSELEVPKLHLRCWLGNYRFPSGLRCRLPDF